MPGYHRPRWINGAPTITATVQFRLLPSASPVLTRTLLLGKIWPSPETRQQRGLRKAKPGTRLPSKTAEDQLGTLALLAPGPLWTPPQGHPVPAELSQEVITPGT